MTLAARQLGFSRGIRPVFAGVDFALQSGGLLQVQGANGAGKSTLLRVLCGLLAPDAGEVQWNGRPMRGGDPAFQQEVAYVGHANGISADLSVLANLRCTARMSGCEDSLPNALRAFALEAVAGTPVRALSQGQRRRVALARLALAPRRLWLLDEPVASLDDDARDRFHALLDGHLHGGGIAVVATHEALPQGGETLRMGVA